MRAAWSIFETEVPGSSVVLVVLDPLSGEPALPLVGGQAFESLGTSFPSLFTVVLRFLFEVTVEDEELDEGKSTSGPL